MVYSLCSVYPCIIIGTSEDSVKRIESFFRGESQKDMDLYGAFGDSIHQSSKDTSIHLNGKTWPSSEEYIDSKLWNAVVPSSYVNLEWLNSGDSLLDGKAVGDESDFISQEDMEWSTRLLSARNTLFHCIDSNLRRRLWNSHVWFSDSQGTFVADFPEVELDSNIKSDYGDAWAILTAIGSMFDIPVIRDCPLTSVRKLTTVFYEALEDLEQTRESEVPEFVQPKLNDRWFQIHGPWFVTVIIDEGGAPSFDIIGSKNINEAYWSCEATAEMNGLDIGCCTALGPYASVEDAQFAKDYFSRVPMDGFDGSGYVEHLEELFAKIRRHEFAGVSS